MTIPPTSCRFVHQVMLAIQAAACACQIHPFLMGLAAVKGLTKNQIINAPNLGLRGMASPQAHAQGTFGLRCLHAYIEQRLHIGRITFCSRSAHNRQSSIQTFKENTKNRVEYVTNLFELEM